MDKKESNFREVTSTLALRTHVVHGTWDIIVLIIHSKYFSVSDWLKPHA